MRKRAILMLIGFVVGGSFTLGYLIALAAG
jgi:hypothetical protein